MRHQRLYVSGSLLIGRLSCLFGGGGKNAFLSAVSFCLREESSVSCILIFKTLKCAAEAVYSWAIDKTTNKTPIEYEKCSFQFPSAGQ